MADRFKNQVELLDSPYVDGFEITPNTSIVFDQPTRAIYVGVTGNLHVEMISYDGSNTELTFVAVPAGQTLPIRVQTVLDDTTASSLIGLF